MRKGPIWRKASPSPMAGAGAGAGAAAAWAGRSAGGPSSTSVGTGWLGRAGGIGGRSSSTRSTSAGPPKPSTRSSSAGGWAGAPGPAAGVRVTVSAAGAARAGPASGAAAVGAGKPSSASPRSSRPRSSDRVSAIGIAGASPTPRWPPPLGKVEALASTGPGRQGAGADRSAWSGTRSSAGRPGASSNSPDQVSWPNPLSRPAAGSGLANRSRSWAEGRPGTRSRKASAGATAARVAVSGGCRALPLAERRWPLRRASAGPIRRAGSKPEASPASIACTHWPK